MVETMVTSPVLPEITCDQVDLLAATYAAGNCTALNITVAPTARLNLPVLSMVIDTWFVSLTHEISLEYATTPGLLLLKEPAVLLYNKYIPCAFGIAAP